MTSLRVHFFGAAEKAADEAAPGSLGLAFNRSAEQQMATPENLSEDLFSAVREGKVDAVRDLLDRGADPDSREDDGSTPLMQAARENYEKIVDVLIAGGANPLLKSNAGLTAQMFAEAGGNVELAKLLAEKYGDSDAVNESTPGAVEAARARGDYSLAAMIEQKRLVGLFEKAAKLRKKAQEKKAAEKKHDDDQPVGQGIASAIAGIYILSGLSKVASKFHDFFVPAGATAEETVAKPSLTAAPPAPAPAPKPGAE